MYRNGTFPGDSVLTPYRVGFQVTLCSGQLASLLKPHKNPHPVRAVSAVNVGTTVSVGITNTFLIKELLPLLTHSLGTKNGNFFYCERGILLRVPHEKKSHF